MLEGNDLLITLDGEEQGYVLNADDQQAILHTSENPNVPLNTGYSTPTQAGGVYDVRDSGGAKAITHLDWSGGAGQKSLDSPDAAYSRFLSSEYIDTSIQGSIALQPPFTATHTHNISGPVFSALGKLWIGFSDGSLKYSNNDGADWSSATWSGGTPASALGGFVSDGTNLYVCCSGTVSGLWSWNGSGTVQFTKYSGITAALERLAYNNGTLYGATGDGAGTISTATTGTYTEETSDFLTGANSTVALVSTQNAVYWVVSKGDNSYVYKLQYMVDLASPGVITEQFAEFPTGFIATCAVGYLGNVDVGGYFKSAVSGVGQGAVYRTANDGEMSILFRIGDRPEDTEVPSSTDNDNRIRAAVAGGLDTYWLTERGVYRWDLRTGGYNHVGNFPGCGAPARVTTQADADELPTGGDEILTVGEYKVHIFKNNGDFVFSTHRDSNGNIVTTIPIDYLLIGGGGGGGNTVGGGGGAGGVLEGTGRLVTYGTNAVVVGAGGAASSDGSDTTFDSLTADGGGAGGDSAQAGTAGGSGGGAGKGTDGTDENGGTATSGQGYAGGKNDYYGTGGYGASGGGGGYGSVGDDGLEEVPS